MSHPNKAKGSRWERDVREFLRRNGIAAYKPAQEGFKDRGDLHGLDPFVAQCKDWRDVTGAVREGLDGAVAQAEHAGQTYGVAIVKRARKPVGEAYAVLRLADFVEVLKRLRGEQ